MPNMNGLEFLEKIMRLRPMPVVMVSTLTQAGAEVTLAALEMGAVDAVGKPSADITAAEAFAELTLKVKAAAGSTVRARQPARRRRRSPHADYRAADGHVAGDRRLHRRGRGPADHPVGLPGDLSGDGRHPAHARDLHRQFRRPPGPVVRGHGHRGRRRRAR